MTNVSENNENNRELEEQSNEFVTVIPVDYSHSANEYNNKQTSEYVIEQFRLHEEYIPENVSKNQGNLYSVSQRVLPTNANFSGLVTCSAEQSSGYSSLPCEWDTNRRQFSDCEENRLAGNSTEVNNSQHAVPVSSSTTTATKANEQTQERFTPVCVYLHNKMTFFMEVEDNPSASANFLCQAIFSSEELGINLTLATQVFALWMCSPLLSLQLKPTQKPYRIRQKWAALLEKYSHGSCNSQKRDEPLLYLQRNVFFAQSVEEKIKDQKILELLYEEARDNILEARYPCEISHYIMLGGIQARIELGPYNPHIHTIQYFREEQAKYLPQHVRKSDTWTWLPISSKTSAEVRLLEQFKRIPTGANNRKLMRKYLDFCWSLPFYGSAFFEGQIEQPVRGLMSLLTHQDIPVLVAINSKGVYVIDDINCTVLLGLKYEEFNWEHARPSKEDNLDCLPCLFLQFMVVENGTRVSKILQVFSRQAGLMDILITGFVNQLKRKAVDESDRSNDGETSLGTYATSSFPSLCNKLNKLTLATFDDDGHLIGQMGSWSFSY